MWSDDQMIVAFDAEAGAVASLATALQKIQWWNEGQARLGFYKPLTTDMTWGMGERLAALPTDFISLDKFVVADGKTPQPWRVFGKNLVMDDPTGASDAGGARLYYWGNWNEMTTATLASDLTPAGDYACLYYALSRFYKRLSSNRAYYKRYATLVGQNAVTQSDLQQEANGYYQDYVDARDDLKPLSPAYAYEG